MTDAARAAEVRRLAVAVMLAAVDSRDQDLHALLADADRDTLAIAVGGLALAVGGVLGEVPAERWAAIREELSAWALNLAAWPE